LALELAAVIDRSPRPVCLLPAHNAVGQTHLFTGELALALIHIEAERQTLNIQARQHLVSQYGEDPVVVREMYAALAYWLLGSPEQASVRLETGLRMARALAQPFGIAQMLWAGMLVAQWDGDPSQVQARAQSLIELCEQEQIALWLGGGRVLWGWAVAQQGKPAAGIVSIRLGLEDWEASGARLIRPYYLALLAEAYDKAGSDREALETIAEALETVERTGERWYSAELHRLQAVLKSRQGDPATDEVEAALCRALDIAREQQAKALELRAAETLARFRTDQGRQQDPGRLLKTSSVCIGGGHDESLTA
jgi:predicted ATPase